jgi:hypothetical protein
MKEFLAVLRSDLNRVYGRIFVLMILSPILLFFLANTGSNIGLVLILGLLILANLLVIVL